MERNHHTATLMRHGATQYTNVFPDIVPEGLPAIHTTAMDILKRYPKPWHVRASFAPRALGTVRALLNRRYGSDEHSLITIDDMLGPIQIFDHDRILNTVNEMIGHLTDRHEIHRVWDRHYMEHPEYDVGMLCESRTYAKRRLLTQLRDHLPNHCGPDHHLVVVSHLELIGSVVHDNTWFGAPAENESYLSPGEAVHLEFLGNDAAMVEFRGRIKIVSF